MKRVAALLLIACGMQAQRSPVFSSETRVVVVDAVVTGKKGESVRDLTAKDFRVWEDNKEQTIRSFAIEAGATAAETSRTVLFFDDSSLSAGDQAQTREAAGRFLDASAGSNRLTAVVSFDRAPHVLQNFTPNAARLKKAMNDNGVTGDSGRNMQAASGIVAAVTNLAKNLSAAPGRKSVVLLTGSTAFAGVDPGEVANLVEACNRSNVAVYPIVLAGLGTFDTPGRFPTGRGGGRGLGANNAPGDNVPLAIAQGTGGLVAPASNSLLEQLQQIAAEQSQRYVIGYTPPDSKEGVCHTLRVKVDRAGTEVRAREAYCTAKPQDLLAESRVEQDLEKHAAAPQAGSAAAIQAPFFYASPNVARVHVSMEIDTAGLKVETVKGKLHAELNLLGVASSPDGDVAARFSDIVKRDFESKQDLDKWRAAPLHYEKEFKIVPGKYNLTVVFSSGGASFGKSETPLTVDAFNGNQFALSGIALSKEVKQAADLGLEASLIDEGTPLIAGDRQFIPTGSTVFAKGEQGFCYFELYAPGSESLSLDTAVIDTKTGKQVVDSGARKLERPTKEGSKIPLGLVVPIAQLSPGAYRLKLTGRDGSQTAERSIEFSVK